MSKKSQLIKTSRIALDDEVFIKLVISKPATDIGINKVTARKVLIKNEDMLSIVSSYEKNDITKNYSLGEGVRLLESLLNSSFSAATLFTAEKDYHLTTTPSGVEKIHESPATMKNSASGNHDHQKNRLISLNRPFLNAVGITTAEGAIKTKMNGKYKQTESFVNIINSTFKETTLNDQDIISIYDMGSGSGYTAFALYDYYINTLQKNVRLTGVDINDKLTIKNNTIASKLNFSGATFVTSKVSKLGKINTDIVIALHACNTATDDALFAGIDNGAKIIIASPCCHQEIRSKMNAPQLLKPMLRFGTHMEQQAVMLTDTIRTLILEINGYKTKLFEFVSDDHSGKNNIIVAIKKQSNQDKNRYVKQLTELKDFYGVTEELYFESLFTD